MFLTTPRRRPLLVAVLAALLVLLPVAWLSAGSAAGAATSAGTAPSAGTTPSGGAGSTDLPEPTPVTSTDYDGEVGGPHQDTPDERAGDAVTPGRQVFIATVLVVTAAIVLTLALRARRRREADGDR